MGLAERRAAKEFETKRFAQFKTDIDTAAGFDVPVEVKWETFTIEGESHLYDECWPKVYFEPLIEALKAVAIDDMGKDALKTGLKRVEIANTKDVSNYDYYATFEDGTLRLDHLPHTNVDDVSPRAKSVQKVLEKAL